MPFNKYMSLMAGTAVLLLLFAPRCVFAKKAKGHYKFHIDAGVGYDDNALYMSSDEKSIFDAGPADPNYYLNSTKRFDMASIADVITNVGLGVDVDTTAIFGKRTFFSVNYNGNIYAKNYKMTNHTVSARFEQRLVKGLDVGAYAGYTTKRYYKQLLYPDPVLNAGVKTGFKNASYSTWDNDFYVRYMFIKQVGIEGGYRQTVYNFEGFADYMDGVLIKPGLGLIYKPVKFLELLLDYRFLYMNAYGEGLDSLINVSDPTWRGHHVLLKLSLDYKINHKNEIEFMGYGAFRYKRFLTDDSADTSFYNRHDYGVDTGLTLGYTFLQHYTFTFIYDYSYNTASVPKGVIPNDRYSYARSLYMLRFGYNLAGQF